MSATQDALRIGERLVTAAGGTVANQPEADRLDLTMPAAQLRLAVSTLAEAPWGYLTAITGLDLGPQAGQLEVLYHFCEGSAVLTLRVCIPRDGAALPSVAAEIPAAALYEREVSEMLGVAFGGGQSSQRLYLPEDWPVGVFPLRKDAPNA